MIIVKLMGGLGNQMFQYATGRTIALKHNTSLKLDHSFLEDRTPKDNFTYRNYELKAFGIESKISEKEILNLGLYPSISSKKLKQRILSKIKRTLNGYKNVFEISGEYNSNIIKKGPNAYLTGYFQSEKYFISAAQIIRKDFTFIPTKKEDNENLIKRIKNMENPVSLHIRRGDYLTKTNLNIHHTCTKQYYLEAINEVLKKVKNPTFIIFSADDPQWANDNIKINASCMEIGEINKGISSYEDMRLMSICKHNIIANSSFSWWGAWLNNNPDKVVIAPKLWFSDENKQKQANELIPDKWIRI